MNHHSLLHFVSPSSSNSNSNNRSNNSKPVSEGVTARTLCNVTVTQTEVSCENTLLPTAVVKILHQGECFCARAFLDQGSEKTFISRRLQQRLMLPTEPRPFQICGMGGQVLAQSNAICNFTLFSDLVNRHIDVSAIVVSKITGMLPSFAPLRTSIPTAIFKDLRLADPEFYLPSHVDLLIGSNIFPQILLDGVRNISQTLIAQNSVFGWFVSGPITREPASVFSIGAEEVSPDTIGDQLRRFWEQEEILEDHPISKEDEVCEELFTKTTFRNPDGRYVVKLPFKAAFPQEIFLGTSRAAAKAQYLQLDHSLKRKPELAEAYQKNLEEYVTLNQMKLTTSIEKPSRYGYNSFYLPHHAVLKPESRSTKVRVDQVLHFP